MDFNLRPWDMKDLGSLLKYANNYNIARNMTNQFPHPYLMHHGKAFIEFANANQPVRIFAIEVNGEAAGGIGLHPQTDIYCRNAELGYWLAESFWGQGLMTRAVLQMVDFGFKTLDIERIFARPFGTNLASQKVLEKAGFVLEATFEKTLFKNGVYEDELIYAVRK